MSYDDTSCYRFFPGRVNNTFSLTTRQPLLFLKQIKELHRLLDKKTMEINCLKRPLNMDVQKSKLCTSPYCSGDGSSFVSHYLQAEYTAVLHR